MLSREEYESALVKAGSDGDRLRLMNEYAWQIRRSYPVEALEIAEETRQLAEELGDQEQLAYSYRNSGTANYLLSAYEQSLTDLILSSDLFEKLGDKHSQAASIRNIGNVYHSIGQHEKAIECYESAIEVTSALGDTQGTSYNMGNIGYVYKLMEEYDKAEKYILEAIELMQGIDDDLGLSDAMSNLGTVYLFQGRPDEAKDMMGQALAKATGISHIRGMASSSLNLGVLHRTNGDYDKALEVLGHAIEFANTMGEKLLVADILEETSKVHELNGDFEQALQKFKEFEQVKSAILETNKKGEISAIMAQSDLARSEEARAKLREANEELEKLSIVANKMNEAVIITDAGGLIIYINDGLIRNSGYTREEFHEFYGANPTIMDISSMPNIEEIYKGFRTSKQAYYYDSSHVKKDGSIMWTSASFSPVHEDGKLDKVVIVYNDITDRKIAEDGLTQRNKDIVDSLTYAKSIQEAILPNPVRLEQFFDDHFILYKPRDIVSGDFYWYTERGPVGILCVVDCTGHGVPGAFMSMMGNDYLTHIVTDNEVGSPGKALGMLNERIIKALKQTGEVGESKDGMDIAMCAFNRDTNLLQFAGARNPVYIIRNGELHELKGSKFSIGGGDVGEKVFEDHEFELEQGDEIYLFSDGYPDQFGGERGKKFMYKRLKEYILSISGSPMHNQLRQLEKNFLDWRGEIEQIDDVCMVGVRY